MRVCAWGLVVFGGMAFPIYEGWEELQPFKSVHHPIEVPIWDVVRTGNRLVLRPQFIQTVRHHGTKSERGDGVVLQAALF